LKIKIEDLGILVVTHKDFPKEEMEKFVKGINDLLKDVLKAEGSVAVLSLKDMHVLNRVHYSSEVH